MVQQERAKLEQSLTIKEAQFVKGEPFTRSWYPNDRKFLKSKFGALFHCQFKTQKACLCRVMHYDRISSYQMDSFFTDLARLNLYKLSN